MARILVVYYSRTGNTHRMAENVCKGVKESGAECDLKPVSEVNPDTLTGYDGIILGSPTYYGHPAAELKQLLDASVAHHGELVGKVGGAFASCGVLGGGAETTVRAMLDALLIHGMVVQGSALGDHYGPVAVGQVDKRATKQCLKLGQSVAEFAVKLHG